MEPETSLLCSQDPATGLSQMNPVQIPTSCFLIISVLISSHVYLSLPSGLFPSGFSAKFLIVFEICVTVLHDVPSVWKISESVGL
jgi:hypothetical protein